MCFITESNASAMCGKLSIFELNYNFLLFCLYKSKTTEHCTWVAQPIYHWRIPTTPPCNCASLWGMRKWNMFNFSEFRRKLNEIWAPKLGIKLMYIIKFQSDWYIIWLCSVHKSDGGGESRRPDSNSKSDFERKIFRPFFLKSKWDTPLEAKW